jgi:hypothetical protein
MSLLFALLLGTFLCAGLYLVLISRRHSFFWWIGIVDLLFFGLILAFFGVTAWIAITGAGAIMSRG